MFKLDLEKIEEPEIKLPASVQSQYSALTYSFPNLEPVHCSMSGVNCCFLTCIKVSQEAGKVVWFHIGKGVCQGCKLSSGLLNLYTEYIMQNSGLDEVQARIKIAGRNINTSDMLMTSPLWQKAKRN